jgi:hypothetical protein
VEQLRWRRTFSADHRVENVGIYTSCYELEESAEKLENSWGFWWSESRGNPEVQWEIFGELEVDLKEDSTEFQIG